MDSKGCKRGLLDPRAAEQLPVGHHERGREQHQPGGGWHGLPGQRAAVPEREAHGTLLAASLEL